MDFQPWLPITSQFICLPPICSSDFSAEVSYNSSSLISSSLTQRISLCFTIYISFLIFIKSMFLVLILLGKNVTYPKQWSLLIVLYSISAVSYTLVSWYLFSYFNNIIILVPVRGLFPSYPWQGECRNWEWVLETSVAIGYCHTIPDHAHFLKTCQVLVHDGLGKTNDNKNQVFIQRKFEKQHSDRLLWCYFGVYLQCHSGVLLVWVFFVCLFVYLFPVWGHIPQKHPKKKAGRREFFLVIAGLIAPFNLQMDDNLLGRGF